MADAKKRKVANLPGGAPGGEAPMAGGAPSGPSPADAARRGLVTVNKLDYELTPDLSVAVSRSNKTHFFSQETYEPGQRAICILNSGAEYARPDRSYLEFTVENSGTTEMIIGQGGATRFIKDIVITSRSGDECERIQDVNRLAAFVCKATMSKEKLNTVGRMAGFSTKSTHQIQINRDPYKHKAARNYDATSHNASTEYIMIPKSETRRFLIPLSMLSGIFRFDKLLPSMFLSGLRIDILFADKEIGGIQATSKINLVGATTPDDNDGDLGWKILNPRVVLDSYQLTDSVQRVLNEEAAMRGMELVFRTFHTTNYGIDANSKTFQCRKAVSRALSLLCLQYIDKPTDGKNWDAMATAPFAVLETQLRIGSLYFPQQAIRSKKVEDTALTCYYHMLRSASKLTGKHASSLTFDQYVGTTVGGLPMPDDYLPKVNMSNPASLAEALAKPSAADYSTPTASQLGLDTNVPMNGLWFTLERSNVQELSGIPINNSRVAELSVTLQAKKKRNVYIYLDYVRLLRVFLQNIEVEE